MAIFLKITNNNKKNIAMKNKLKKILILTPLIFAFNANAEVITETFDNNTYNNDNFEIIGSGNITSDGFMSNNRSTFRTVGNYFLPTENNVLTISADLKFGYGDNIAFIGFRSDGVPHAPWNEPIGGMILRLHNFVNGHSGMGDAEGIHYTQMDYGNSFYYNPVNVLIEDNGSIANVTLRNLSTGVTHSFSHESSYIGGGHIAFSGDNSTWGNISIGYNMQTDENATSVPLSSGLALFIAGLAGLSRRKSK